LIESGERNANYIRTTRLFEDNDDWGLLKHFADRDVRELKTSHWAEFLDKTAGKRPDLSTSTKNMLGATGRVPGSGVARAVQAGRDARFS
jgi:hypothetical protein